MATMHMEYKDNTSILKVEGVLSIQDASALRDCLLKALGLAESLLIDLSGSEAIDLACLQVLCSAHKTYSLAHKGIRMAGELSGGVVRSLFAIALSAEGCDRVSHGPCLWATGGKDG